MNKYKVIGMRKEQFINQDISGHNCDFVYTEIQDIKWIACIIDVETNKKYELEMWNSNGECGSGWCTATWGEYKLKQVNNFIFGFTPIKTTFVDFCENDYDITCDLFTIDSDGGDGYYPSGSINVKEQKLKPYKRNMNNRPVWIFKGPSNLGKTYLSSRLEELNIYETDSKENLPDLIKADVIIIGNKYNFNIEDIKPLLFGEVEIICVNFELYK